MSPDIRFTHGINRFDTRWIDGQKHYIPPEQFGATWSNYVDLLRSYAAVPRLSHQKDKTCPWTSPMLLGSDGEGRGIDNVTGVAAFASVDLDAPGWTLDKLNNRLDGFRRIFYTTTKSRPTHQRWRIIVMLDREITIEEHGPVWNFMNDIFDSQLDAQTKNVNRILYVPAQWVGADNIFVGYDGDAIGVDSILNHYKPVEIAIYDPISDLLGAVEAPDGTEIVTARMVQDFITASPGGRFWKLLCAAAARHRRHGWGLSAADLCAAAMQVSLTYAPQVHRQNPLREASRALAWVAANIQPEPPLTRLRDRIRWQLYHSKP
jgi:hypothetical protein